MKTNVVKLKTEDRQCLIDSIKQIAILLMDKPVYDQQSIAKCLDIIAPELIKRDMKEVKPLIETIRYVNMKICRELFHAKRVSQYCEQIAQDLHLEAGAVEQIRTAGFIHDIGKLMVDESILTKKGALTQQDKCRILEHPDLGETILMLSIRYIDLRRYVVEHHERWDGNGYPHGLKSTDISIQARIISVADAYDAMTNDRSYRKSIGKERALNEIKINAGGQFDPDIAQIFIEGCRTGKRKKADNIDQIIFTDHMKLIMD